MVSRRFAIMQSDKHIDDLKESGTNRAYSAVDASALHDIDYMVSLCHFISTTIYHAREHPGQVTPSPFENCRGANRPFACRCAQMWSGRAGALTCQRPTSVPVSVSSKPFSVLMVHHFETGKLVCFTSNSLPFGASASVFGFDRVSRSLWHAATVCCGLLGGVFCDDFPFVEPERLFGEVLDGRSPPLLPISQRMDIRPLSLCLDPRPIGELARETWR